MPEPPRKGEKKQPFINRCVKYLIEKEDKKPDQARAQCESLWNQHQKKKRTEDVGMLNEILSNQFWLMEQEYLEKFLANVDRSAGTFTQNLSSINEEMFLVFSESQKDKDTKPYAIQDGIATIDVKGPLIKRASGFLAFLFGIRGMEQIGDDFKLAVDDNDVSGIFLNIDSPGGSADGTFTLANTIYQARGKKPIMAFGDDRITSGALWVGSAADFIAISGPTTHIGSIGVIGVHHEVSEAAKNAGFKFTVFSAGEFKKAGNQFEPLSKKDKEYIQGHFDYLYNMFTENVAKHLNVSDALVRKNMAEGRIFIGDQGVQIGLADAIMDKETAMALLKDVVDGKATFDRNNIIKKNKGGAKTMDNEKLEADNATLSQKVKDLEKTISDLSADNTVKELNEKIATIETDLASKVTEIEGLNTKIGVLETEIAGLKESETSNSSFVEIGKTAMEDVRADIRKLAAQVDGDGFNQKLLDTQLAAFGNDFSMLKEFKTSYEKRREAMFKTGDLKPDENANELNTDQKGYELGKKIGQGTQARAN